MMLGSGFDFDPNDLTTHGVVLGRTGSGKTGLITRILESLDSTVHVIAFDVKHDLTNLAIDHPKWRVVESLAATPTPSLDKFPVEVQAYLKGYPPETWIKRLLDPPTYFFGLLNEPFMGQPLNAFLPPAKRQKAANQLQSMQALESSRGSPILLSGKTIVRSTECMSAVFQHVVEALPDIGASSKLRLLIVVDECRNVLPGVGSPSTKAPLATLLSRGRAFGVGVLLGTQHPMDICYRSLSNVGTWFVGNLRGRDLHRDLRSQVPTYAIENLAKRQFYVPSRREVLNVSDTQTTLRGPVGWPHG